MAFVPSRTTSAHEKRTSTSNSARSRVASSRAGDAEKVSTRNEGSPVQLESGQNMKGYSAGAKRLSREVSSSERRTERTTTTTKDKLYMRTRSPVKESASAGNRKVPETDRAKGEIDSPSSRKRQKEPEEGTHPSLVRPQVLRSR